MSTIIVAGVMLVALPIAFNAAFAALAATFDYPDILRRPTHEVLARFRAGGTKLVLWWWIFALTAAALPPLAVLLARALDGPSDKAIDIVFQAFNRYLGVAVGEHLGYLLTGAWSILVGFAFTQTTIAPTWLGIPGIVIGGLLALCSLEFVGPAERTGWRLAGTLTPITYIAWSLWLIAIGIALLV
jgi:hypothetical protein